MAYVKKYGMIGIVVLLMVASYLLTPRNNQVEEEFVVEPIENKVIEDYIYVDIKGSVIQPGVYKLKTGARLFQVIEYAGGFLDDANTETLNLSLLLTDQMMVYIPSIYDVSIEEPVDTGTSEIPVNDLININTADQSTLETLPGIGPSTATSIIEYRLLNGDFKDIEDIMNVSGIGTQTYENIKSLITV